MGRLAQDAGAHLLLVFIHCALQFRLLVAFVLLEALQLGVQPLNGARVGAVRRQLGTEGCSEIRLLLQVPTEPLTLAPHLGQLLRSLRLQPLVGGLQLLLRQSRWVRGVISWARRLTRALATPVPYYLLAQKLVELPMRRFDPAVRVRGTVCVASLQDAAL